MNPARLLSRWYLPATLLVLLLTLASGYALRYPGLNSDFSLRTLAGRNDQEFQQLEQFTKEFAGVELAFIVVESHAILSAETQKCLAEIGEQAERLPAVANVASISKVPWFLRSMVASSDIARGLLVSKDGKVAAILLQMHDDSLAGVPRSETVASLKDIVREAVSAYPDHQMVLTGPYVLSYEMTSLVWADLKLFGVLGALAALLTLSVALGTWRLSIYPVAVGVATVLLTLGLSIWWQINTALNLPMLVLLVAVLTMANCIHLAVGHGEDSNCDPLPTVRRLLWPCFGVVATTIVGFAAVGISDLQPVRTFALLMSSGLALGLLLTLLGAFLALNAPPRPALLARPIESLLRGTLRVALRWPRWLGVSFLIATLAAVGLTSNLQFSLRFLENFRVGDPLRSDYEFVETKLTPMQSIEVLVRRVDGASPVTPDVVAATAKLTSEFRQREAISRSLSLVDVLTFAGGELPVSQAQLDRRLLAIEATLKVSMGDKPLALFLSDDQRTLRISFIAYEGPSASEKLALGQEIARRARELLSDEYQIEVTGLYYFYAHVAQSLLHDQFYTLAASAGGVFLTLAFVLGSWRLALIGMAPGVVAGASCVGLMVLFDVPFNTVTSMMLAIALGIAVDDTVHYLWRYRSQRATGNSPSEAIAHAHLSVGQACTLTSIVVATGFAVMSFSRFLPIAYFGGVTSVVMVVALAANLLLLPALLTLFRR